ncbi:unnamed protein product [Lactuca virosa]|uniref:Uncharacterized protein n=1 Tax=Lactuca virosa TaxID=75947 RepID=A0AAU9PTK1_9ASTR|nr:unnamed protein product [Lactuca virosa]
MLLSCAPSTSNHCLIRASHRSMLISTIFVGLPVDLPFGGVRRPQTHCRRPPFAFNFCFPSSPLFIWNFFGLISNFVFSFSRFRSWLLIPWVRLLIVFKNRLNTLYPSCPYGSISGFDVIISLSKIQMLLSISKIYGFSTKERTVTVQLRKLHIYEVLDDKLKFHMTRTSSRTLKRRNLRVTITS